MTMAQPNMNDAETVAHLRQWAADDARTPHGPFAWPTDACGYRQHIRFVDYRNGQMPLSAGLKFSDFVLAYADKLEKGEIPPCRD